MKKYKINEKFDSTEAIIDVIARLVLFILGPFLLVIPFITDHQPLEKPLFSIIMTIFWLAVEYRTSERCCMVEEIKEEKSTTDNKEVEEYLKKWSKQR